MSDVTASIISVSVTLLALGFMAGVPIMRSMYKSRIDERFEYQRKIIRLKAKIKKLKKR